MTQAYLIKQEAVAIADLINKVTQGDCLEVMRKQIEDDSIDLTVTSPPYDNLRTYNGYSFDFEGIAQELYRITKPGGVVVWVVGDATIKGSETGTSFKQALYFKEVGFNLHDTMIYDKGYSPFPSSVRYNQSFEYMFILSKGKPTVSNLAREPRTTKGNRISTFRRKDGTTSAMECKLNDSRVMRNIWLVPNGYMRTTKDKFAYKHPAMFPEELAERHILTWSNQGDTVLDIFGGSGTTAKMAILTDRNFIHIELNEEYCDIANKRIDDALKAKLQEA